MGSISMKAGNGITLSDARSAIYTAGRVTSPTAGFAGRLTDASGGPLYFPTQGAEYLPRGGR